MLLLARVQRVEAANARSRGALFAFAPLAPSRAVDGATTPLGPLARRWARERLGDLVTGGRDRHAVESHALRYGLVSPYTALVAIGSDVVVSGGVKHSVAVPVSLPSGMHWQAVRQATEVDLGADDRIAPTPPPLVFPPEPASPVTDAAPRPRPVDKASPPARRPAADQVASDDEEPAPRKEGKSGRKTAGHRDDDTDAKAARKKRAHPQPAKEPAADADDGSGASRDDAAKQIAAAEPPLRGEETITVTGSTIGRRELTAAAPVSVDSVEELAAIGGGRRLRLSAALGGGLAIDRGARGLAALDVRLQTGYRYRVGGEAALWLVGGTGPQGRALVTVARDVLAGRLELGLGAGLHVGGGIGPAGALRLGIATPLPWLAGYLRYDAALLVHRPGATAEQAITLGLELSY
jgi:hypothetical protein